MDDRLRICLWMMGGGGFGCLLGGFFGALAAAVYERSGGAAGTRLARNVVENFLQSGDRQPSPTLHAALIGAADGFFFMGCLGLVGGAFLGLTGQPASELLGSMVIGSVVLVGGAIVFGGMAYALRYLAAGFLSGCTEGLYSFAGTLLGSFLAASLLGEIYGPVGGVLGMIIGWSFCRIGWSFCRVIRRYSPKFHPPLIEKTLPQPRSHADTDITGQPHSPTNDDFRRST